MRDRNIALGLIFCLILMLLQEKRDVLCPYPLSSETDDCSLLLYPVHLSLLNSFVTRFNLLNGYLVRKIKGFTYSYLSCGLG